MDNYSFFNNISKKLNKSIAVKNHNDLREINGNIAKNEINYFILVSNLSFSKKYSEIFCDIVERLYAIWEPLRCFTYSYRQEILVFSKTVAK